MASERANINRSTEKGFELPPLWQLFVDTGGTFTDALAVSPGGKWSRIKVLSTGALRGTVNTQKNRRVCLNLALPISFNLLQGATFRLLDGKGFSCKISCFNPESSEIELEEAPGRPLISGERFEIRSGEEAPLVAARLLTHTPAGSPLPPMALRLGTTLATNALLTGQGASTALFITQGFGDLLEIGTQQRRDLFTLKIDKPQPLYHHTVEVSGRITRKGEILSIPDPQALKETLQTLKKEGIQAVAVALLHSDRYPEHEKKLSEFLDIAGFTTISLSSDLAPSIGFLARAATAVVDATLSPIVKRYLDGICGILGRKRFLLMTSAGGLTPVDRARPKDLLLSGPAGGVVGAARAGRAAGVDRVISFDMGGTSTDVARFDGDFEYLFEHRVGDAHLVAPALAIETVAAGGGSVCSFDGSGFLVGPESAGAFPGPACYGAGGPLTLTDVNLLLGRLDPERFEIPIDPDPAQKALTAILEPRGSLAREQVLEGLLAIANERMAEAIRRISVQKGYDPRDYALVAFGGAGAQHACAVATLLGVKKVIVPPDAGLLSACGLAGAVVERFAQEQVLAPLAVIESEVPRILDRLAKEALAALPGRGARVRRRIAEMRFSGQETALQVEVGSDEALLPLFQKKYRAVYGHEPGERQVELQSLRVVASLPAKEERASLPDSEPFATQPQEVRRAWFAGRGEEVPCFSRDKLKPGACLNGPALVFERHSATAVEPGWALEVDRVGSLILQQQTHPSRVAARTRPEAVTLELFTHRFEALAGEMGEALRRTAVSTNIKERLDFSCALLDAQGELVVNAPHIPVHLGSMGLCVREVVKAFPLRAGDRVVTNHPAYGGSHLPDLTVIAPVFSDDALLGYTAARAHHAEIGGILPGSMPSQARRLAEEGVVIPPFLLVEGGKSREEELRTLLLAGPWPSRGVNDNLADLNAAVAACHGGAERLAQLARTHGREQVSRQMDALKNRAERKMRRALEKFPDGLYQAEEFLDDGTPLRVRLWIEGNQARLDFTGTGPVHPGNLNATPAIVRSAVIYVLRLLVEDDLPLNEGLMAPIRLHLPECLLNPPFSDDPARSPSIVGGNVETSQRLVDTLIKALGLAAGSQGTMNNVIFGNEQFSYYETVCGGCGAGPDFHGASAVHSHMTNTRITDPEIVEHRYPVRVESFSIRSGSGGEGRFHGGDGVTRTLAFLKPLELSLLTQHRTAGPNGLRGGRSGKPGTQRLIRADGTVHSLAAIDSIRVASGDRLVMETPGGGGYGKP